MKRRKLLWRIYPYYLVIVVVSLVLSVWYASTEMERLYVNEVTQTLESRARLILDNIDDSRKVGDYPALDKACKTLGRLSDTRVTLVDSAGRVLGDSERNPAFLENHGARPEIVAAKRGAVGTSTRFSATLQQTMIYVAIPVTLSGGTMGVVAVLNDITRLKKLEKVRPDFVANVSHELKTPITAILGSVETLRGGVADGEGDSRRILDMISRHADRLSFLVDDLLSLARLEREADRGDLVLEETAISGVVSSAVQACQMLATQSNVSISSECPDGLAGKLDAAHMEQALVNLIENAVKHSDPGGKVAVRAAQSDGMIVIDVEDHGCGIENKHLPRIFERFYRVDRARSRQTGGTGLGLAIVKHIALLHGGTVSVKSTVGEGSTFSIHLPGKQ
jgi:two-component system phosphate regulon sensor histidine kinase PhoR